MSGLDLTTIMALLTQLSTLAKVGAEAWANLQEKLSQEADEKKREALIDACQKHDLAAVRAILFDVGS